MKSSAVDSFEEHQTVFVSVVPETQNRVWQIELKRSRPVRNAVDRPTALQLAEAFRLFEHDPISRVAILCSDGPVFCAGADLHALKDTARRNDINDNGDGPMGPTRMLLSKPVIAAIQGFAVAGGLELALWADLRVVEEDAVFGVFCRRWGVPLIDGGTVRLPRLIGLSRALDLILTGRPVEAGEAERIGLANRVVPKGKSRESSIELAKQISLFPFVCVQHDRLSAYEQQHLNLKDALRNELEHGKISAQEMEEGVKEFTTKKLGRHGGFSARL